MSPPSVYWLEQREAQLPTHQSWLSARELARLETLRIPKRRADWLLGRSTAKLATASYFAIDTTPENLSCIEVIADESGAPTVSVSGEVMDLTVSLSHSNGVAVCALCGCKRPLGCDLEKIEDRSDAFIRDYFTVQEQHAIMSLSGRERQELVTAMWSAKESALKALHLGLRADTRIVNIPPTDLPSTAWSPFRVEMLADVQLCGYWKHSLGFVNTVVTTGLSSPPVYLV